MRKSLVFALSALAFSEVYGSEATLELKILQQQIKALEAKIHQLENSYKKAAPFQSKAVVAQNSHAEPAHTAAVPVAQENTPKRLRLYHEKPTRIASVENSEQFFDITVNRKYWRLFDTDTQMAIEGFVKLTGTKDLSGGVEGLPGDVAGSGRYYLAARNIALKGSDTPPARDFYMNARETRFAIETISPVDGHDIHMCIEMDFLGDGGGSDIISNNYNVRFRKANIQYKGFTVGQNWSAFTDMITFPEIIDRNGPVGNCQLRQTQLKYSTRVGEKFHWDFAIENPESETITPNGTLMSSCSSRGSDNNGYINGIKAEKRMPDFIAAVKYKEDWGHVRLAGVLRENTIRVQNTGSTKSRLGYAFDLTTTFKTFGNDGIIAQAGYGAGAGRYFTETMKMATYFDGNKLHNEKALHGSFGYKHQWTEKYNLRSTLSLGYIRMLHSHALKNFIHGADTGDATKERNKKAINKWLASMHVNLQANLTKYTQVGVEYMFAKRKTELNQSGSLKRFLFAVQMNF